MIIALKTEELEDTPLATYIQIFSIDGVVYLDEKMPGDNKYEGLEFFDWLTNWKYKNP